MTINSAYLRSFAATAALALAMLAFGRNSVSWDHTTHNFGAFDETDGRVSCQFVFVNTGTEPVSIVAARPSCGCTAPSYPTAPIAPGDSGTVTVTYDPAGRPGRFDKFVAVDFSYPDSRTKLHIVGTVVGSEGSVAQRFPVECGNGLRLNRSTLMFGDVAKDKLRTAFLTGYNMGYDTLRPSLSAAPPFIDAEFTPAAVAPGEQVSIACFFRSDRTPLYGLVADSIAITPTPGAQACTVPVVAMVREDFSRLTPGQLAKAPIAHLENSSLDFGNLERIGEPRQRTTTLLNRGRRNLEIRRIYTTDPGVSVSADRTTVKKGKQATITVTIDPASLPGSLLNARISIITNDPANPTITLRAVGELR